MASLTSRILNKSTEVLIIAIITGALSLLTQKWLSSDLEYKIVKREGYLASILNNQGLTMTYKNQNLKNISIVDFIIYNRTGAQYQDAQFAFQYEQTAKLISSGIIPPKPLSQIDTITELQSRDANTKIYKTTIIPKQISNEYFEAVFVFEGEKAPSMTLASLSKEVSITQYKEWKDMTIVILITIVAIGGMVTVMIIAGNLIDHLFSNRIHKQNVTKFENHIKFLQSIGELKADEASLKIASDIYKSFSKPKENTFWAKRFKKHY